MFLSILVVFGILVVSGLMVYFSHTCYWSTWMVSFCLDIVKSDHKGFGVKSLKPEKIQLLSRMVGLFVDGFTTKKIRLLTRTVGLFVERRYSICRPKTYYSRRKHCSKKTNVKIKFYFGMFVCFFRHAVICGGQNSGSPLQHVLTLIR